MAGHSQFANIKHRKEAQDAKRAVIFMKFAKEIYVAARGNPNPETNAALRLAIMKARSKSMPAKNIQKALDKASGNKLVTDEFTEYVYEGYLPGGVSIMVMCLTNNHNRLTSNIRTLFSKNGGTIAKAGAVSYQFDRKGVLEIAKDVSEEVLFEWLLEVGVDDIETTDKSFYITCDPSNFNNVKEVLDKRGIKEYMTSEITFVPNTTVLLSREKADKTLETIEKFEDDEDIQEVFHNIDSNSLNN